MGKINALEKQKNVDLAHMQIVYLNHYNFSYDEIAAITEYAEGTIKNYIHKFANLLEKAKKIFYHITQNVKREFYGTRQLVYLFKFYNFNNELICSKVGTTTRLPEQRMNEELRYYSQHDIPVARAEMCSIIDCGELPAEGAESQTRAYFIRKYPKAFCKNDRFFGVDIPVRTFDKIVIDYLQETA